ncbi:MAG: trigger factor [Anaerolineae bacterium]|nr:trigger factor [Anaerolineae bacterium]
MNIEKQFQEDHTVKLVVEVDQEKMAVYKKRAAAKISERGNISGFRPGKAPYHIVERTYGEAAITEQAIDMFIDAEYSNILKEADVNPGASGSLENIESMDPPKFIFSVPLAPVIDLGDYTSVRLPYEWKAPEQKDVDAALEELRQMYASTETVERAIESGDYVLLDVSSETSELNRTGFATFVRKEERDTEWPYNGFANELIGLKAGESKTVKHSFPKDWEVEDLQGKDVELTATIKTVRGVTLPEVNDEFAKTTGAGETVDALMEAVKKDVETRSQNEYDDKYFVDLIEIVKANATIKYHEHTLEHEGEHVLQDLSQRLAQQGMDLDTYFKMRSTTREQFVETDVKPVAQKRLERGLILDEIVRKEQIQIDDEALNAEYMNAINNLAMQGMDFSKVRGGKKGQKELSQAIAMDAASRVMTRKALDMLKSIATGNYKPFEEREAEAKQAAEAAAESAPAEAGEEKAAE